MKKKLSAQRPGVEAGVWIEKFVSAPNLGGESGLSPDLPQQQFGSRRFREGAPMGYPGQPTGIPDQSMPNPAVDANGQPVATGSTGNTNVITVVCRAVNLSGVDPSANSEIAFAVESELKSATNYFDPKLTTLTGQITPDEATGTFTFGLTIGLVNPLQLQ
jgi:hypothetical protein